MTAKHVFVIDDEARICSLVRSALSKCGFEVTALNSGGKALELLQTARPDLVILDIGLPDVSGLDVCRKLKHSPATSQIPVIMLTGRRDQPHIEKAFENGADDFIPKPFEIQVLEAKVMVALRKTAQPVPEDPSFRGYLFGPKIGEGGMGVVYRALQVALRRPVAVKILQDKFASDKNSVARFVAEARLAAALSHPNIVNAIDFGRYKGGYFFVMEFVDGCSVNDTLLKNGSLAEDEALRITRAVADALEHARSRGLIHGDVKPANVLLTSEGVPKLADLGLARTVADMKYSQASSYIMGTPHYIAPEQARGDKYDCRADIYSLGATLFHMVVGCPPFTGVDAWDVIDMHQRLPRPWPDGWEDLVSPSAAALIKKAMAIAPADRYQTPAEMVHSLDEVLKKRGALLMERRTFVVGSRTMPSPFDTTDDITKAPA